MENYNIKITSVKITDKETLWNVLQKYLYELSGFYNDEIGEDGNYPYRFFENYFEEDEKDNRFSKFIFMNNLLVGFAMINTYSYMEEPVDYCLAEYTIFPAYRGLGIAEQALDRIIESMPGSWQLKYNPMNVRGKKFWEKYTSKYNAQCFEIEDEVVVKFSTNLVRNMK